MSAAFIHDFRDKLADSQEPELERILRSEVYGRIFPCSLGMASITDISIQRTGRDLRVTIRKPGGGASVESIEEKVRGPQCWRYNDVLIETHSNEERGTAGWGLTSEAEWLAYIWQNLPRLRVLILPLQDLRRWFVLRQFDYEPRRAFTSLPGGGRYTTVNRIVPWDDPCFTAFRQAHGYFISQRNPEGEWSR